MKFKFLFIIFLVFSCASIAGRKEGFPPTERRVVRDLYHGIEVEDPYRWLEDDKNPKVMEWTRKQSAFTEKSINSFPHTEAIRSELSKLMTHESRSLPYRRMNRYFFSKNSGTDLHDRIFMREGEKERVVLDPILIDGSGKSSVDFWSPSPSGKYLAYGVSRGGTEDSTLHLLDIDGKVHVGEPVAHARYSSVRWKGDEKGFYYTVFPDGSDFQHVQYRSVDSEVVETLYRASRKRSFLRLTLDGSGRYLLISESRGSERKPKLLLYDIQKGKVSPIWNRHDTFFSCMFHGAYLYSKTNRLGAGNYAVDRYSIRENSWERIVGEKKNEVIDKWGIVAGRLVVSYMVDVSSRLSIFSLDGKEVETIPLPTIGTVEGISGDPDGDELFFEFSSFAYPPAIFRYREGDDPEQIFRSAPAIRAEDYTTEQVFYRSKDGTKIPLFLVYKKGFKRDGNAPTLLAGYGGFRVSYNPRYRSTVFPWLDRGGIYAIANIRGGGEYGERWHRAGMKDKKENGFNDFAWAMKYLVNEGFTRPERLGIMGGSNGGLLTGAMMTSHPHLFRAALVAVPLLDMLRFHRFLIGIYWVCEYGSSEDPEMCRIIMSYSPYHNVVRGVSYPAALITAGANDTRVAALHAKKMAARLQYANSSDNPVFLWVDEEGGHGRGKSLDQKVYEKSLIWSFFFHELGVVF